MATTVRLLRWLASALTITVITIVVLECALQTIAGVIKWHEQADHVTADEDTVTILTLGDSNTYGVFVDKNETWPAKLQALLTTSGFKAHMVNIGWPGTNSTVLNWQLEPAIQQVQPDLILIMIGVNDYWSQPIFREEISAWQYIKLYSRVYRLWQLGRFNLQNTNDTDLRISYTDWSQNGSTENLSAASGAENMKHLAAAHLQPVNIDGGSLMLGINTVQNEYSVDLKARGFASLLHYSMAGIIGQAGKHKIPVIFLNYGANIDAYQKSNHAIKRAQELTGATVIDVRLHHLLNNHCRGYQSAPDCKQWFFPDNHPTADGYAQIAQAVATFLTEHQSLAKYPSLKTTEQPAHHAMPTGRHP